MKWMIASDIHGSARFCRAMLERYHAEGAQRLLLLGDLLYHGPRNDLPEGYAPKEVISMLNSIREQVLCVRGNCEAEVDQMVLEFPVMADYCLLEWDGRTVFATHGHHYNEEHLPPLPKGGVLLHGHTHLQSLKNAGDYYYLNPGSVSIPKGGTCHSYMIYENGVYTIRDLQGDPVDSLTL